MLGLIDVLVNSAIANAIDGDASGNFIIYNYHYVDLKDNGEKIAFKQNNPYSFKLYDLLNDVEAGIKVGWQGALYDKIGGCPIFEIGTTYINNFHYNGPNGSDKNQINNGIRSSYAIGILFEDLNDASIMLRMDMAHYDIFNTNKIMRVLNAFYQHKTEKDGKEPIPIEVFKERKNIINELSKLKSLSTTSMP